MRRCVPVRTAALLALLALLALATGPAGAGEASPAQRYFTDVPLISQDGETLRFYSDLLEDKVVVINVFFTTCESICPVMTRNLTRIQEHVGDRLGRDVHILSISVDPERDTPAAVKRYAERWGARPGWYFLTGERANVETALGKLGQKAEVPDDHSTVLILGNESTGLWKKALGMASVEELLPILDSVLDDAG